VAQPHAALPGVYSPRLPMGSGVRAGDAASRQVCRVGFGTNEGCDG
jgi:hypothetical protein